MRSLTLSIFASATLLLGGCASGGLAGRDRPDEFAVVRTVPLVVPPDFALVPPATEQAVGTSTDSRLQAIEALFGGPAARSAVEQQLLSQADRSLADIGIRSSVADPSTNVVDKGATTQAILAVPEGDGQEARVDTPQQ